MKHWLEVVVEYQLNKDSIDLPYRDRAHAKWDSEVLNNLPIYAVCEGKAYLVED